MCGYIAFSGAKGEKCAANHLSNIIQSIKFILWV
jgi:hypothetical protein